MPVSVTVCLQTAIAILFLVGLITGPAVGRRKGRPPPLVEEAGRRKSSRQTHCHFGNQWYELEERWRPDLGPPFGVLYCVHCECMAVQRKKRIVARARCKNIKNDCPKPTCENPTLLADRCCKICPGEDFSGLEEDLAIRRLETEDDEQNNKEYAVLLTGRGVLPPIPIDGAARGYLTYSKRNLHYSIRLARLERPNVIRFMDEQGNILEEHEVSSPSHHVNESKVCGVWRKVPKVYRRLLLKERLVMTLASSRHVDGMVGGKILRNMRITKEVFSSLLLPSSAKNKATLGSGGIAIISTDRNSIHIIVDFNGIFLPTDGRDVPVYLQVLEEEDDGRRRLVTENVQIVPKVHPEFNTISIKIVLSPEDQHLLPGGKMFLRLASRDDNHFLLGVITPKSTCNVFQSTMVSLEDGRSAGSAVLGLNSDNSISYQVETTDPQGRVTSVVLETEDATRQLAVSNDSQASENVVHGVFHRTSIQEVEMLLNDDLYISVQLANQPEPIRGHIKERLYVDAFVTEQPLVLSSATNSSAVGQAWMVVDKDCHLHYNIFISVPGKNDEKGKMRYLVELLEEPTMGYPQQRVLQKFDGDEAEDIVEDLNTTTLDLLKYGHVQLLITSKVAGRGKNLELKKKLLNIAVPVTCSFNHREPNALPDKGDDSARDQPTSNDIETSYKCFYDGTEHDDGSQWKAQYDDCTMCSCQRGRVVCDSVVCPTPNCENPVTTPGECCAVCPDSLVGNVTSEKIPGKCYFEGDKKYYPAGSRWHPYIPPFGFSRCALCTCETRSLVVECTRITCPPLPCPEKEAYREHPMSCCKQCPKLAIPLTKSLTPPGFISGQMSDQQGEKKTPKEILSAGGCRVLGQIYANGDEWHPTVQPYGEMKCVKCHCKDGKSACIRQKCPTLNCQVKVHPHDECCPRCLEKSEIRNDSDRKPARRRKARARRRGE